MRSLRTRLLALWLMLATSAAVTGFVLFESYRQSANSQIIRAEDVVARGCRDIGDRYSFVVAGWNGSTRNIDDTLKQRLVQAVQAALARAPGVEGGIWQTDAGSLAYAFPTYEGTGPKTDLPEAELASIRQVNDEAARTDRVAATRQTTRSQVLLFHACPIAGPLSNIIHRTRPCLQSAVNRVERPSSDGPRLGDMAGSHFGVVVAKTRAIASFTRGP